MQRAPSDPRATSPNNPDGGFASFVAAVSEPLTRLAYVLTVGVPGQPEAGVLAANALAQVRRQWREVESAGLPEQLAVDALLSAVLKRRVRSPSLGPVSDEAADAAAGGLDGDVDQQLLREASWRAFLRLSPRQRALVVFTDPSVAAVRFAGLDVPPSLGSPRRQAAELAADIVVLRTGMGTDAAMNAHPATRAGLDTLTDDQLVLLTGDVIRAHAPSAPPVFDPNTEVGVRVAHLRRRALLASGVVVVLIAAAGVSAVVASTPKTVPRAAASAASSTVAESPTARPSPRLPAVVPVAAQPSTDPDQPVVAWRVRGDRLDSPVLLARIEAAFSQAHPDATSRPQVLLIADTPAFRLAYVTATMPGSDVAQSWFSGPTGSDDMAESAFGVGRALVATSVIAARLHQASGSTTTRAGSASTTELVIIAAPTAPSIQVFGLADGGPAVESIALDDGIAVRTVGLNTAVVSPTQINISTETYAVAGISDIELDASKSYATGDAATQHLPAVPQVRIERGVPDPALLADALLVAQAWQHPGPELSPAPVVLWGGTDSVGTKLVVARVHAIPFDLLVLEWSGDAPRLHGEVLVRSTSPEVPVAFAYRSAQGTRIGIISEPADKAAALSFEGSESPVAMFDDGGFASIPLTGAGGLPSDVNVNASPPPSNEFSGLIDATVEVELFGFDDQVRTLLNVPPAL